MHLCLIFFLASVVTILVHMLAMWGLATMSITQWRLCLPVEFPTMLRGKILCVAVSHLLDVLSFLFFHLQVLLPFGTLFLQCPDFQANPISLLIAISTSPCALYATHGLSQ